MKIEPEIANPEPPAGCSAPLKESHRHAPHSPPYRRAIIQIKERK